MQKKILTYPLHQSYNIYTFLKKNVIIKIEWLPIFGGFICIRK